MAGEGAGKSAGKIRGAGGSAGEGAAPPIPFSKETPPRSTLEHLKFSQQSSQSFSGFPRFSIL